MSGICGWSNNTLETDSCAYIVQKMAYKIRINKSHTYEWKVSTHDAVAAIGAPKNIGTCRLDGWTAAVCGSIRFANGELEKTAKEQGLAQAILDGYRRDGVNFLQQLSGPFALCIADAANRRTLLAIDKLGIGALFYTIRRDQLVFSSNAKALGLHPDAAYEIDPQAIFDYLYFHMVPSPRCIFRGVAKLLPGQYLLFDKGQAHTGFHWQPSYQERLDADPKKLQAEFLDILDTSVARASAGLNAGAFLSGGTDSSTVAGTLQKLSGFPINTYSIGFDAEGFDETHYARLAAKHFGTNPHEYYLKPQDVVDAIPIIAQAYDEPFGNASAVPAYYCAKLAKADGLEALLAGDGGDELFAGNERYAKQKVFEIYHQLPGAIRRLILEPTAINFPGGGNIPLIAKAQSYIRQANIPLPDRLEAYNFLRRAPLTDIFDADFLATVDTEEPIRYLRETYQRTPAKSYINRMLFLDLKFTLADNDLRKVNRMCELAQMEVRYPLLDEDFIRFAECLPVPMKLRGMKLRYFFKQALKNILPAEILTKQKHGFGLPFGLWMDNYEPLRELAHASSEAFAKRGILKPEFLDEMQRLHRQHPSYYGVMIWVVVMLEQWLQAE